MVRSTSALTLAALLASCAPHGKPPETDAGPGGVERASPVYIGSDWWLQDRYAIMGRWYDYESSGHTITPRPFAWIVRTGSAPDVRYAAFRMISYYDPDTTEAGLMKLSIATWSGTAFTTEQEWTASRNIKITGEPICLDLFGPTEVDCTGDAWQLQLRMYKDMSPDSVIVILDPGVFLRSWSGRPELGDVVAARVDADDLTSLPDPTTIADLVEGPAGDDWTTTDWAFGQYAPNLPQNGMVLGTRWVDDGFVGRDDVYFLANGRFTIAKLTVKPVTDGDPSAGIAFRVGTSELVREDSSVVAYPALRDVVVDAPAVGAMTYLSFEQEDLLALDEDVAGASWPFLPPDDNDWDLAVERLDDDTLRLVASPSVAVFDTRQYVCDPAHPPTIEEMYPPLITTDENAETSTCE